MGEESLNLLLGDCTQQQHDLVNGVVWVVGRHAHCWQFRKVKEGAKLPEVLLHGMLNAGPQRLHRVPAWMAATSLGLRAILPALFPMVE
jgi:hypothetical protein